jgi:hypothetical protein
MCLVCGHVACCDSSKNKHATKHFHTTGHPLGCKKSLAAHIDGISAEEFVPSTELIRSGDLKDVNCAAGIAPVERDAGANHRNVAEP